MTVTLWWILGAFGALCLALALWLGPRARRFRRLRQDVAGFLTLRDVDAALAYVQFHPQLLGDPAYQVARTLVDRAWARGRADEFLSGVIHLGLLDACRQQGVEPVRQMGARQIQAGLDALDRPSWKRALDILGRWSIQGEAALPTEGVDDDLVDAMQRILAILRPLAEEPTATAMDELVHSLLLLTSLSKRS